MTQNRKVTVFVNSLGASSLVVAVAIVFFFPPPLRSEWVVAFSTLLALAVVSALLAVNLSDEGSTTAMDFVPQLAAVVLLGPAGTVVLTVIEQLFTEFFVLKKPAVRAFFNFAQVVLASAVASLLYVAFGGETEVAQLTFRVSFPPFIIAVLGYFAVNSISVAYVIAISESRAIGDAWRDTVGTIILFDVVMSSLAYIVAFLYLQWGSIALLSAVIPIIGLRYSYGVNIALSQLSQDLLKVLIKTLEARDRYTSGHSLRVSERSGQIAAQLGTRPKKKRLIETAALLHDIGKIDLAYGEILRQTGPLTPEQRELIRAHPDKGVEIVRSVRSIDPEILMCIRHHHEWFDGSGYPTGISGEEIPLGARIIMISDSVDAMMTDRPYRKALKLEEVRQELLRNSGTQFDPIVVEATLASGVLENWLSRDPDLPNTLGIPQPSTIG